MNNLIIGIAGGSGSGKTTLALRLKERFGEDEVRLISHDSYYKRHDELPFEERCKLNYDHPDAFDNDLLIEHLRELKAGSAITQYRTTVKPMHEAFVEPSKRNADIIIPNGGENGPAIEMLAHHIRSLIQKANMQWHFPIPHSRPAALFSQRSEAAVVMVFACISGASAPQRGCGSDNSASLRCCEGWRRAGPSVPRSCPHPRPEARHCPE